jgi:hypothetical protein
MLSKLIHRNQCSILPAVNENPRSETIDQTKRTLGIPGYVINSLKDMGCSEAEDLLLLIWSVCKEVRMWKIRQLLCEGQHTSSIQTMLMINAARTITPQQRVGRAYGNRSKNQIPLKIRENCSVGFASPPIRVPPNIPRFRENANQLNAFACVLDVLFSVIIERIALAGVSQLIQIIATRETNTTEPEKTPAAHRKRIICKRD